MHFRKSVFRNLVLISQVGISTMTPIFLCTYVGYQIDRRFGTIVMIPLLIMGTLAGGRCAWMLVKRSMEEERRENEKFKRKEAEERRLKSGDAPVFSKPKQPSRIQGRNREAGK